VHQTCLAHLLRRCCKMLEVATPGEVKFSLAMKEILQDSLKLRDRRDLNQIGEHELAIACEQLEDRLDALSNATIALLLIGACPTTWCGNAMPSSRFSTAPAWMQPTTVQSRPIGLW
jgi:hypothetical protein